MVGGAAERLGITQPALSQTIKGLEEALGVVLLDRRPGRRPLTDAGELFLAEAVATMAQADRAERIGKRRVRRIAIRTAILSLVLVAVTLPRAGNVAAG